MSLTGSKSGRQYLWRSAMYREPLCPSKALPRMERVQNPLRPALPGLHRSYGLMRQANILRSAPGVPRTTGLRRLLRAPAACWPFPTLSPQSVYRRLDPYPAAIFRCVRSFLPGRHRPHATAYTFGSRDEPAKQLLQVRAFGATVIPLCSGSHTC